MSHATQTDTERLMPEAQCLGVANLFNASKLAEMHQYGGRA